MSSVPAQIGLTVIRIEKLDNLILRYFDRMNTFHFKKKRDAFWDDVTDISATTKSLLFAVVKLFAKLN